MNECTFTVFPTLGRELPRDSAWFTRLLNSVERRCLLQKGHLKTPVKVEIVLAGLQPPEDMTSLGVEGIVVAVDVAALRLSHEKKGSLSYIGHTYIQDWGQ